MKFTAKGRKYEIDQFGVIFQTDHRPFTYNEGYAKLYDDPKYTQGTDILQALRFGFVQGAHGSCPDSIYDIGYGNGAFLNFIKPHVVTKFAHDITGVPVDGIYILKKIDSVNPDVTVMWDVLEHFPDCSFLRKLRSETLCLSLPYCHFHTEGLEWFENEYHHLKPDEHVRHFNPWSLRAFMRQFGWEKVAESTHENIIRRGKGSLQNILSMAFKR